MVIHCIKMSGSTVLFLPHCSLNDCAQFQMYIPFQINSCNLEVQILIYARAEPDFYKRSSAAQSHITPMLEVEIDKPASESVSLLNGTFHHGAFGGRFTLLRQESHRQD